MCLSREAIKIIPADTSKPRLPDDYVTLLRVIYWKQMYL